MEKTHWKKVFNSDYLGCVDLEDGKDLKAIIKEVKHQMVVGDGGKKSECNVAFFTDTKIKPMILNVTNCKIVKKFTGSNFIEDWKNVAVQIYAKNDVKLGKELVEGLRFREVQPQFTQKTHATSEMILKSVEAIKTGAKEVMPVLTYYREKTDATEQLLKPIIDLL